jgi:hypothetical protein
MNLKSLLRWMVNMQGGEFDLGGFKGRTNKLIHGCYSWWVGGCFPLLETLGISAKQATDVSQPSNIEEEGWHHADGLCTVTEHTPRGSDLSGIHFIVDKGCRNIHYGRVNIPRAD